MPSSSVSDLKSWLGSRPVLARISAATKPRMMPSLSVVHTVPSRFRNEAPALSSPAKPKLPLPSPSTNHLKPTGVSTSLRFSLRATRSMIELETTVLPIAASSRQFLRSAKR